MQKALFATGALVAWLGGPGPAAGAAAPGAPMLPSAVTIHIKNFKFNPTPVKIHAGDRVTFVNDDDEAHTATSDDKSFDSEGLDSGGAWQHVFTKPGTYNYFCELHPYMKATLVVLPAAGAAAK
jgi:plastocyanin